MFFLRNFLTQKAGDKEGLNLFATGKFFHARELRPLQGAESNSSDKSESDKILLVSQIGRPRSLAKISNVSHKLSPFLGVGEELLFAKISNVITNRTFLLGVSEFWIPPEREEYNG